jgi:hypothetical protein
LTVGAVSRTTAPETGVNQLVLSGELHGLGDLACLEECADLIERPQTHDMRRAFATIGSPTPAVMTIGATERLNLDSGRRPLQVAKSRSKSSLRLPSRGKATSAAWFDDCSTMRLGPGPRGYVDDLRPLFAAPFQTFV